MIPLNFSRSRSHSRLRGLAVASAAVLVGVGLGLSYLAAPNADRLGDFEVKAGDGAVTVADRLKEAGAVRSKILFLVSVRALRLERSLQPGVHDLAGAVSYAEMARRLATGGADRAEVTLVMREGWTLRELRAELERLGLPAAAGLYDLTGEPAASGFEPPAAWLERYPFLKTRVAGTSLEGFLFPDTYRFFPDADAEKVVTTLLDNFGRRMDSEMMGEIVASRRTFREVVVMASLLEREVRTPEDRRLVADLFWRRLERGMRLQADSTVNYATGANRPSATAADLEADSLYNTYKYGGLPPGPISNPGLDAFAAAVRPTPNNYWYFLTDPTGAVHYAKTYDEHLANKAKYLR